MDDTQRLDWLESTCHQVTYDPDRSDGDPKVGHWWCVDRVSEWYDEQLDELVIGWVERPEHDTIRGAIDNAIREVEGE